jgi:hypothetical protein
VTRVYWTRDKRRPHGGPAVAPGRHNNEMKLTSEPGAGGYGAASRHHPHGWGVRSQLISVFAGPSRPTWGGLAPSARAVQQAGAWCRSSGLPRREGSGPGMVVVARARTTMHCRKAPTSVTAREGQNGHGPRQPSGSPLASRARVVRSRFAAPPLSIPEAAPAVQRVVRALLGNGAALGSRPCSTLICAPGRLRPT